MNDSAYEDILAIVHANRLRDAISWCDSAIAEHTRLIGYEVHEADLPPVETAMVLAQMLPGVGLAELVADVPIESCRTHQQAVALVGKFRRILKETADELEKADAPTVNGDSIGSYESTPAPPPIRPDTTSDAPKKSKKKLSMTVAAADCARLFKTARKKDPSTRMQQIVENYVEKNERGSVSYILRVLSDNPDQWKT